MSTTTHNTLDRATRNPKDKIDVKDLITAEIERSGLKSTRRHLLRYLKDHMNPETGWTEVRTYAQIRNDTGMANDTIADSIEDCTKDRSLKCLHPNKRDAMDNKKPNRYQLYPRIFATPRTPKLEYALTSENTASPQVDTYSNSGIPKLETVPSVLDPVSTEVTEEQKTSGGPVNDPYQDRRPEEYDWSWVNEELKTVSDSSQNRRPENQTPDVNRNKETPPENSSVNENVPEPAIEENPHYKKEMYDDFKVMVLNKYNPQSHVLLFGQVQKQCPNCQERLFYAKTENIEEYYCFCCNVTSPHVSPTSQKNP